MKSSGFTLLEVLIAIVLLAFVTIFTAQSINNALKSKEKVQREIDKSSTMRDALKVLERDINNAFNYQDFNARLFNMSLKARAQMKQQTTQSQAPGQPPPGTPAAQAQANQNETTYKQKDEYKYTGFVGEKNSLELTTLSNVRMSEDEQASSQSEVGYRLKNCRRLAEQNVSSQCLWRRVAPIIDDDLTKGGHETVLLENVQKFDLRYLGPGKEKEWIDTWISTEHGDALTKGKFPYAVEITIEVQDKNSNARVKDKPLRMTIVAAIRNPNNPKQGDPNNPSDPNNPNNPNNPTNLQGVQGVAPAAPLQQTGGNNGNIQ